VARGQKWGVFPLVLFGSKRAQAKAGANAIAPPKGGAQSLPSVIARKILRCRFLFFRWKMEASLFKKDANPTGCSGVCTLHTQNSTGHASFQLFAMLCLATQGSEIFRQGRITAPAKLVFLFLVF